MGKGGKDGWKNDIWEKTVRGRGQNWEENSRGRDLDVSRRQQEGGKRKRREWNEVEAIRKKAEEQEEKERRMEGMWTMMKKQMEAMENRIAQCMEERDKQKNEEGSRVQEK